MYVEGVVYLLSYVLVTYQGGRRWGKVYKEWRKEKVWDSVWEQEGTEEGWRVSSRDYWKS